MGAVIIGWGVLSYTTKKKRDSSNKVGSTNIVVKKEGSISSINIILRVSTYGCLVIILCLHT